MKYGYYKIALLEYLEGNMIIVKALENDKTDDNYIFRKR